MPPVSVEDGPSGPHSGDSQTGGHSPADAHNTSGRAGGSRPATAAETCHDGQAQTSEQRRSPQPASGQPEEGNPGRSLPEKTQGADSLFTDACAKRGLVAERVRDNLSLEPDRWIIRKTSGPRVAYVTISAGLVETQPLGLDALAQMLDEDLSYHRTAASTQTTTASTEPSDSEMDQASVIGDGDA